MGSKGVLWHLCGAEAISPSPVALVCGTPAAQWQSPSGSQGGLPGQEQPVLPTTWPQDSCWPWLLTQAWMWVLESRAHEMLSLQCPHGSPFLRS